MTGRRLLLAITVAIAAMCAAVVLAAPDTASHLVIRWTARTSFVLFVLAYAARPAVQLWPGPATKRLLAERKWLGLGFAVSHAFHLAGIVALAAPDFGGFIRAQDPGTAIAAAMFVLLGAMAVTSIDRVRRAMTARSWKRLHAIGMHLAWLVFFVTYVGATRQRSLAFAVFALILVGIAAMRITAWAYSARRLASSRHAATRALG